MAMFTRTIKTYKAQAWTIAWENGQPVADLVGECTFVSSNANKTEARAALTANGVKVKRGMEIRFEKVSEALYGMDVETFMQYAKPIASGRE